MIYPKNPKKVNLYKSIENCSKNEIKTLYRMLIEFDTNKHTSDLREFLLKHYKGEK